MDKETSTHYANPIRLPKLSLKFLDSLLCRLKTKLN